MEDSAPVPTDLSRPASEQATVLLAEDDDATRHSIVELLRGRGYTVRAFVSCEDLLARVARRDGACLLVDYHFGGMNGFDLLEALRQRGLSMPTVFYTGRFDASIGKRAAAYGEVVAFLQKPWSGEELMSAVHRAARQAG